MKILPFSPAPSAVRELVPIPSKPIVLASISKGGSFVKKLVNTSIRLLTLPARFGDSNKGLNPTRSGGTIKTAPLPPLPKSVQEWRQRTNERGLPLKAEALWREAYAQLKDLPTTREALNNSLDAVQQYQIWSQGLWDQVLKGYRPISKRELGILASNYAQALKNFASKNAFFFYGALPVIPESVELAMEWRNWAVYSDPKKAEALSEEEMATRGYSRLAVRLLSLGNAPIRGAHPVEGIPQAVLETIFTGNKSFQNLEETEKLLTAARDYFAMPPATAEEEKNAKRAAYAEAMKEFLSHPGRANAFVIELSFYNTFLRFLLQDPEFFFEKLAAENVSLQGDFEFQSALRELNQLKDSIERSRTRKEILEEARNRQLHQNLLSLLVYHYGPRLLGFMKDRGELDRLGASSADLENLIKQREKLCKTRFKISEAERQVHEAINGPKDSLMNGHDSAMANLYELALNVSLSRSDEEMARLRSHVGDRYNEKFDRLRREAAVTVKLMRRLADRRTKSVAQLYEGASAYPSVNSRDFNRSVEKAVGSAVLLEEQLQKWLRKHGLAQDRFRHVVPLFANFTSKVNPIPFREKLLVIGNLLNVLGRRTLVQLNQYLSGDLKGDGTTYADWRMSRWAADLNTRFHDTTFFGDTATLGLLEYLSPILGKKHMSWGKDFDSVIGIFLFLNPNEGDPLRLDVPRILAKSDLSGKIPVAGVAIERTTIPVGDDDYQACEIRAAQAISLGDIPTDRGILKQPDKIQALLSQMKIQARIGPRPVALFPELTMPEPDEINPVNNPFSTLGQAPSSSAFPTHARDIRIAMMAEVMTGKPQMLLWPTSNGAYATYPRPPHFRLHRGEVNVVIPDPIYLDSLPGMNDLNGTNVNRTLWSTQNLQRLLWILWSYHPDLVPPLSREDRRIAPFMTTGEQQPLLTGKGNQR